jgi:hypothetical protein
MKPSCLACLALLALSLPVAASCPSIASAVETPPAEQNLNPARLLRVDGRLGDDAPRNKMFRGLSLNDGSGSCQIMASAPAIRPDTGSQRMLRLTPGRHALYVVESIPDNALDPVAANARRRAGAPRPKTLVVDVAPGEAYLVATRLLTGPASLTRSNAHWEPVIWKQEAATCR